MPSPLPSPSPSPSRLAFTLVLALVGCGTGDPPDVPPDPASREHTVVAALTLEVSAIDEAMTLVRAAVENEGGYVGSTSSSAGAAHLELRVAAEHLDALREGLAAVGRVTHASEQVEDVTLAHADQRARLDSAREEEARLTAMFADRTATLADVLAVEHELARVHSEIAARDTEERTMRDAIRMAHLSVDLVRASPAFTEDPMTVVTDAARIGARMTWALVIACAALVAALTPAGLLVAVYAFVVRILRRNRASRARA